MLWVGELIPQAPTFSACISFKVCLAASLAREEVATHS